MMTKSETLNLLTKLRDATLQLSGLWDRIVVSASKEEVKKAA